MSSPETASLAKVLRELTDQQKLLRQGVVTAVAGASCSVKWGNAADASPNQRFVRTYSPRVGDVVFGIRDVDDVLILGAVAQPSGAVGAQMLAWHHLNRADPVQPYAGYTAGVPTNITVTTTDQGTRLFLVGVPVTPGRLLRFSFHVYATSPPTSGMYWVFRYMVSTDGGGFVNVGTDFFEPFGTFQSHDAQMLWAVPDGVSTVTLGINVSVSVGTGTLYLFDPGSASNRSWLLIEDIGPAA